MLARKPAHCGKRILLLLLESSNFHGKLNTPLRLDKDFHSCMRAVHRRAGDHGKNHKIVSFVKDL